MSTTIDLTTSATERRRDEARSRRIDRMADLVAELTGCDPLGARHVLRDFEQTTFDVDHEDPLALVARAMVAMGQPSPLREPAYLQHAG